MPPPGNPHFLRATRNPRSLALEQQEAPIFTPGGPHLHPRLAPFFPRNTPLHAAGAGGIPCLGIAPFPHPELRVDRNLGRKITCRARLIAACGGWCCRARDLLAHAHRKALFRARRGLPSRFAHACAWRQQQAAPNSKAGALGQRQRRGRRQRQGGCGDLVQAL